MLHAIETAVNQRLGCVCSPADWNNVLQDHAVLDLLQHTERKELLSEIHMHIAIAIVASRNMNLYPVAFELLRGYRKCGGPWWIVQEELLRFAIMDMIRCELGNNRNNECKRSTAQHKNLEEKVLRILPLNEDHLILRIKLDKIKNDVIQLLSKLSTASDKMVKEILASFEKTYPLESFVNWFLTWAQKVLYMDAVPPRYNNACLEHRSLPALTPRKVYPNISISQCYNHGSWEGENTSTAFEHNQGRTSTGRTLWPIEEEGDGGLIKEQKERVDATEQLESTLHSEKEMCLKESSLSDTASNHFRALKLVNVSNGNYANCSTVACEYIRTDEESSAFHRRRKICCQTPLQADLPSIHDASSWGYYSISNASAMKSASKYKRRIATRDHERRLHSRSKGLGRIQQNRGIIGAHNGNKSPNKIDNSPIVAASSVHPIDHEATGMTVHTLIDQPNIALASLANETSPKRDISHQPQSILSALHESISTPTPTLKFHRMINSTNSSREHDGSDGRSLMTCSTSNIAASAESDSSQLSVFNDCPDTTRSLRNFTTRLEIQTTSLPEESALAMEINCKVKSPEKLKDANKFYIRDMTRVENVDEDAGSSSIFNNGNVDPYSGVIMSSAPTSTPLSPLHHTHQSNSCTLNGSRFDPKVRKYGSRHSVKLLSPMTTSPKSQASHVVRNSVKFQENMKRKFLPESYTDRIRRMFSWSLQ